MPFVIVVLALLIDLKIIQDRYSLESYLIEFSMYSFFFSFSLFFSPRRVFIRYVAPDKRSSDAWVSEDYVKSD